MVLVNQLAHVSNVVDQGGSRQAAMTAKNVILAVKHAHLRVYQLAHLV